MKLQNINDANNTQIKWITRKAFVFSSGTTWMLQIHKTNIGYMAKIEYDNSGVLKNIDYNTMYTSVSMTIELLVKRIELNYEAKLMND